MIKTILFILSVCCTANENLIWYRIPQFYVADSVNNFLNNRQINNCYYKFQDEDTFLLKCWKNNKLVDVEIYIKNKKHKRRHIFESLSI